MNENTEKMKRHGSASAGAKARILFGLVLASASVLCLASLRVAQAAPPNPPGENPHTEKCTVCHNGHNIEIPCPGVADYLIHHPGDTAGSCEATPDTNR